MNIDMTKLNRNYKDNPILKGKEKPLRLDLVYLYEDYNMSCIEIGKYFGVSEACIRKWLKFYNIKTKSRKEIYERTSIRNLTEYGVKNQFEREEIKNKSKNTWKNKLGVDHPQKSKEIRLKTEKTCIDRFGGVAPACNKEVVSKAIKTNINQRGVKWTTQDKTVRQKQIETLSNKYGDGKIINSPFCNREIREKSNATMVNKYGVKSGTQIHISKETLEIVNNKELLTDFINKQEIKNATYIALQLGIDATGLIQDHIIPMGLENLIDKNTNTSSYEKLISRIYDGYFVKNKVILKPQEIDLYNEERKFGIEFNGNYWHGEGKREKDYHQKKSLSALDKGIFLFHIWEYEWLDTRQNPILKSMISNLLGLNKNKIYARKCKIQEIDGKTKTDFLNKNHIQGTDPIVVSVKYGLFYNSELVAVMTFCRPKFNKVCQWELSRFCSKAGTNIVGGAGKLFKYFLKNKNPNSIVSYSDIAKTRGGLYKKLGFKEMGITNPSYIWTNSHDIISKFKVRKNGLLKDTEQTEREFMESKGYFRLFNCGTKRWIWNRT